MQESDWQRLEELAAATGSEYSGKPSWRRLILRIARGEVTVRATKRVLRRANKQRTVMRPVIGLYPSASPSRSRGRTHGSIKQTPQSRLTTKLMDGSHKTHELEERREEPFHAAAGSVPNAAELLERADDMLARADIMLDGWQQALDWHHDYERFKAQNAELSDAESARHSDQRLVSGKSNNQKL